MMTNIFNIFDPSSGMLLSMNWVSMMIIFIMFPYPLWLVPSRMKMLWLSALTYLFSEFKVILSFAFPNIIIILSLFTFIMWNNFLGLFPYIFTSSSHMSFCTTLSLNLWLSIMIFGWMNFTNSMLTHLTPTSTPPVLMPFMVIIESTSLIIRPITLSIRLTANMVAGHLLLSLLGSSGQQIGSLVMVSLILTQILLYALEIAVAFIQAYVFSILTLLYSSEI